MQGVFPGSGIAGGPTVAYVAANGSDSAGAVGNGASPFATIQGAIAGLLAYRESFVNTGWSGNSFTGTKIAATAISYAGGTVTVTFGALTAAQVANIFNTGDSCQIYGSSSSADNCQPQTITQPAATNTVTWTSTDATARTIVGTLYVQDYIYLNPESNYMNFVTNSGGNGSGPLDIIVSPGI